jgi:predicted dehydrogenase
MDYTRQPLPFKLRKAVRYSRLYGVRRTLVKIRSQYHMERSYGALPRFDDTVVDGRHVGILGCGKFAYSHVAYFLKQNHGAVIRGVMDPHPERAASLFERYGATYYTTDPEKVIADPHIDTIFITSNHASHADYGIAGMRHGKAVHIEKPHAVTESQLERLVATMQETGGRVGLGFNRPDSPFGRIIRTELEREDGPAMLNWFIAGHEIPEGHWYYREEEGGRVLGNLCHWTDFVFRLIPEHDRFPIVIQPTRADQADANVAVTYTFGDGSIAALSFSSKGHMFEGVRETFSAHRGNALIRMDDFQSMTVEVVERKTRHRSRHRDHGHERRILESYRLARDPSAEGVAPAYVWETGMLFIRTKQALEEQRELTLHAFDEARTGVA